MKDRTTRSKVLPENATLKKFTKFINFTCKFTKNKEELYGGSVPVFSIRTSDFLLLVRTK